MANAKRFTSSSWLKRQKVTFGADSQYSTSNPGLGDWAGLCNPFQNKASYKSTRAAFEPQCKSEEAKRDFVQECVDVVLLGKHGYDWWENHILIGVGYKFIQDWPRQEYSEICGLFCKHPSFHRIIKYSTTGYVQMIIQSRENALWAY